MNKLKKLYYKWLAVTDRLSEAQFDCLCLGCENEDKDAFDLMRAYLSAHRPSASRMDKLYRYGEELSRLYLETLYTRSVNEKEQRHLVLFMPLKDGDVWPCELSLANLGELFDTERPYKIRMYVAKYRLPEKYEQLLVSRVKMEENDLNPGENSYRNVLKTYMWVNEKDKFRSAGAQISLLSLADDQYFKHIIKVGGMKECWLKPETVAEMIAHDRKDLLSFLLRETCYNDELGQAITEKYPELSNLVEVSKIRLQMRQAEIQVGRYIGAAFPTPTEREEMKKSDERIAMFLEKGHPSPSFCTWVAAQKPDLAAKALKAIQLAAKKLAIND